MSLYRQSAQKIRKIFAIVLYHKFQFFQHKFFIAICVNISIHFVHGIKTARSLPADGIQAASTVPLILGSENRSVENRSPGLLPMSSFSKQRSLFVPNEAITQPFLRSRFILSKNCRYYILSYPLPNPFG